MAAVLNRLGPMFLAILALALAAPIAWAQDPRSAPSNSVQAGRVRLEELRPQELPDGACGMFVWARGLEQPIFILAAMSDPAVARINARGVERRLVRSAFSGALAHGHFESQTYTDGRITLTLEVQFDPDRPIRDGAVIQRGILRLTDDDGWVGVVPIGGMVACQR